MYAAQSPHAEIFRSTPATPVVPSPETVHAVIENIFAILVSLIPAVYGNAFLYRHRNPAYRCRTMKSGGNVRKCGEPLTGEVLRHKFFGLPPQSNVQNGVTCS